MSKLIQMTERNNLSTLNNFLSNFLQELRHTEDLLTLKHQLLQKYSYLYKVILDLERREYSLQIFSLFEVCVLYIIVVWVNGGIKDVKRFL